MHGRCRTRRARWRRDTPARAAGGGGGARPTRHRARQSALAESSGRMDNTAAKPLAEPLEHGTSCSSEVDEAKLSVTAVRGRLASGGLVGGWHLVVGAWG